ncbi:MAG: flagellar protein FlaG [Proteobacteria bacterium]|nr:flagellar protein FlaG [Pseudomonadota bacterium]
MSIQGINNSSAAMDANLARIATQQSATSLRGTAASRNSGVQDANQAAASGRSADGTPDAATPPTRDALLQAIDEVQKVITPVAQNLRFSIDQDTGETVVKVVDAQTDQVIRQMPSEEVLAMSKAIDKLKGLLIKQQV